VIAAGDEIAQYVLAEQLVDVVDEPDGQHRRKGERHVLTFDR
jgi:hypothetical protein